MKFDVQKTIIFIRSLYNGKKIPLHIPELTEFDEIEVTKTIRSTFVSSVGSLIQEFENAVAIYTKTLYAVACVNGTSALHLALISAGVKPNDEVITQPLSFVATTNAIIYCNASPIFIDIDKHNLGLSPDKLRLFLEENTIQQNNKCIHKKTQKHISACVPVHLYGHPCAIESIKQICNEHNIALVEDSAEGLGSFYKKQHVGSFGSVGIISFNGNKIITTGGGGMVITNNERIANKARHLSTQAKTGNIFTLSHDSIGFNYRMPSLNAALGVAQMKRLPQLREKKRIIAKKYIQYFSEMGNDLSFWVEPKDSESNYWLNTIIFKQPKIARLFLEETNKVGILTRPAWKLLPELPMYKGYQMGDLSTARELQPCIVNLPSSVSDLRS